jgi:hypothetical protein
VPHNLYSPHTLLSNLLDESTSSESGSSSASDEMFRFCATQICSTPATGPCLKPFESSSHPLRHARSQLPVTSRFSLQVFQLRFCRYFLYSPFVLTYTMRVVRLRRKRLARHIACVPKMMRTPYRSLSRGPNERDHLRGCKEYY